MTDAQTRWGSFPNIYQRFVAPVRLKCHRLLGQTAEAEEVAHDAFLRLVEEGPRWIGERDPRAVMAWLYRTSTRLCIDRLRRRRETAATDADENAGTLWSHPALPTIEQALAARRLLARVVDHVAPEALAAVVLCRIDGLSQPEAAAVLTLSERTVRRLLDQFDADTADLKRELTP